MMCHDVPSAAGLLLGSALQCGAIGISPRRGWWNPLANIECDPNDEISSAAVAADPAIDALIEALRPSPPKHLVIDVDGNFLTDADRSQMPSLAMKEGEWQQHEAHPRMRMIRFAHRVAIRIRRALQLPHCSVVFRSGCGQAAALPAQEQLDIVTARLIELLESAPDVSTSHDSISNESVNLCLLPHLGDVIASVAHFERLLQWLPAPAAKRLMLAADTSSMVAQHELPIAGLLERHARRLRCVMIRDRVASTNTHRVIGTGELAFDRLLLGLREFDYDGAVIGCVEGHDRDAVEIAEKTVQFLQSQSV
ncbi:MAG: hypothetical protein AAFP90_05700 [Planctomycetota bacterium]